MQRWLTMKCPCRGFLMRLLEIMPRLWKRTMLGSGEKTFEASRGCLGREVAPVVASIEGFSAVAPSRGRVGETSVGLCYSLRWGERSIALCGRSLCRPVWLLTTSCGRRGGLVIIIIVITPIIALITYLFCFSPSLRYGSVDLRFVGDRRATR